MKINEGNYGEKLYRVTLGTSLAWTQSFEVYAYNEGEAIDLVADYCEEHEIEGLYTDWYGLFDCCETSETVDEYVAVNNLNCCGNSGIYLNIVDVREVA